MLIRDHFQNLKSYQLPKAQLYPDRTSFGKTAFGVADPNEAEKLFEKLSFEPNNVNVI